MRRRLGTPDSGESLINSSKIYYTLLVLQRNFIALDQCCRYMNPVFDVRVGMQGNNDYSYC